MLEVDVVTAIVQDVASSVVLPRWRALVEGDVEEKAPGDLVTVVDRESEAILTERLREVVDAVVVGEEACTADSTLVEALAAAPRAWLVDPLDGTRNFVNGSPDFAVMVALVDAGETVASWIVHPVTGRTFVAERGGGAFVAGERLRRAPAPVAVADLTGAALVGFLDDAQRAKVEEFRPSVAELGHGRLCAGVEYALVAEGGQDFALFWRTLPWDHAPGSLLLEEAGGVARHLDGSPYRSARPRKGLLAAADPATHALLRAVLQGLDTDPGSA